MKLAAHPRLYATAEQLRHLALPPMTDLLRRAAEKVAADAREYVKSPQFDWVLNTHNAHLLRARKMQTRVVTLLVRYFQTRQAKYREAAIAHVREMGRWEYWSWITWRQGNSDPTAIYDLSYGENSMTLAIAYDWLHGELTDDQRAMFRDIASRRSFESFLLHTDPASQANAKAKWWFKHKYSNWNTVCAGGAGMLALSMYGELPQTREVLRRVEASFKPYMKTLVETDGSWPEGIGYWNYGMRYAFMYLLSHENATGWEHPLLRQPATRKTLSFPLDFTPHNVPCSFSDVNRWTPMPFHFATAQRLGADDVVQALAQRAASQRFERFAWPDAADTLLLEPIVMPTRARAGRAAESIVRLYKGLDWGVIADQMPQPKLFLSVRGGTTEVPHGHRDLTSFHCVADGQAMITSLGPGEYLDTTFSPRRYELFETTPPSKNVVLIDGVGITGNSTVKTSVLKINKAHGLRLDATEAMGTSRDGPVAKFYARAFLMLNEHAAVIIDRIVRAHPGRVEARMFTFADVKCGKASALLKRGKAALRVTYACNEPATLHTSLSAPTTPGEPAKMLRWCADKLHKDYLLVTLLSRGQGAARLNVTIDKRKITINAAGKGWRSSLKLSDRLMRG